MERDSQQFPLGLSSRLIRIINQSGICAISRFGHRILCTFHVTEAMNIRVNPLFRADLDHFYVMAM